MLNCGPPRVCCCSGSNVRSPEMLYCSGNGVQVSPEMLALGCCGPSACQNQTGPHLWTKLKENKLGKDFRFLSSTESEWAKFMSF
ncbi:hypothetical protein E2C01_036788 [Portunus trituberculatus]|uniref:Uncharacterized protein n=1 Tax=Portunus trituberculatus TaxID=210409 RepID=A0A5B7F6E4_PORTR|nr:hypothetical protein [Portunus trituberculatus]